VLAIPGAVVGAKTGTAEVTSERPDDTHAWVIAFAGRPGEAPSVAVAVLVESVPGQGQQTGGGVAAPIARDVIAAALGLG
jgi:peptidoglycan glycosyltransferase